VNKIKIIVTTLLFCISTAQLLAQNCTQEFGFQSDNDSFLAQGSDRYYTNGLFIFYRRGMEFKNPKLANKVLGIEIGQKLFNAQTGGVPDSTYIDRPFAGYLYAGVNINYLFRNESNFKIGLQAGVIGPAAKGKEVQQIIHNTFGFYELNGWQYQIKNNVQINVNAEYNRLLLRKDWFDLTAGVYGMAGTGFNGAGIGPLLRFGNFNQLFNSVSMQSTATRNSIAPLHKKEVFLHYKPTFNYVGYDATVQGTLFNKTEDPKNDREITSTPQHTVFSNQVGLTYGGPRWVFDFTATFNTKEVKTQVFNTHQWGSVTIMYRFSDHKAVM
jgi:lipid A 3-O-deacylase